MPSPWIPTQRPPTARPWAGIALFVGVPLLSLILLRMLWSGSSLWFLLAGILLIAAAALLFLNRRPHGLEMDRSLLGSEHARFPLILAGGGVIFLTMLLVPNFSGGDSPAGGTSASPSEVLDDTISDPAEQPEVVDEAPPADTQPEVVNDAPPVDDGSESPLDTSNLPEGYQVHVVASGDTLWGIAEEYDTSVEEIVSANNLTNPEDLQLDQELMIPPGEASASAP